MARNSDPATLGVVVTWTYGLAIVYEVLRADDSALGAIEEAVETAQRASSDIALIFAEYSLGGTLLCRDSAADRRRGLEMMVQAIKWQRGRMPSLVPVTELLIAQERAGHGDRDAAIPVMRQSVDVLHQDGRLGYAVLGTGVLVEALLERGAEGDLAEAQEAVDGLADLPADEGSATLRSRCCGCARCSPGPVATRSTTGIRQSVSRDGGIAWLRRTHRPGRGDESKARE